MSPAFWTKLESTLATILGDGPTPVGTGATMSRRSVKKSRCLDGDIAPLDACVVNSTDSTGGAAFAGVTGALQVLQNVAPAEISRPHVVQKGIENPQR